MTYTLPPYICAKLREEQSLSRLNIDIAFQALCLRRWRTHFIDKILSQRVSAQDLRLITNNQEIKRVYQCDLESEFENITVPRGQQTRFNALVYGPTHRALESGMQQAVTWWKSTFQVGLFYSLPVDVFEVARGIHALDDAPAGNAIVRSACLLTMRPSATSVSSRSSNYSLKKDFMRSFAM